MDFQFARFDLRLLVFQSQIANCKSQIRYVFTRSNNQTAIGPKTIIGSHAMIAGQRSAHSPPVGGVPASCCEMKISDMHAPHRAAHFMMPILSLPGSRDITHGTASKSSTTFKSGCVK